MASKVLVSILSMGGISLVLGFGLVFASKKFAVETDPRVDEVNDALPGANCGACGYPGCAGLAADIVAGKAAVNACIVGGPAVAEKIAKIMGTSSSDEVREKDVARVLCQGGNEECKPASDYHGVETCKAAVLVNDGQKSCPFACVGFGDCVAVCPVNAIKMGSNGLPIIDENLCTGCNLCVMECPKSVIELSPEGNEVHVRCRATLKGKDIRKICTVGCIGCKMCEKTCLFDAIRVKDNVASIDYSKCTNCMKCVEVCPTNSITSAFETRKKAHIDEEKCIGCTLCARNCPVEAISGEVKKPHNVDLDKCIGCGICYEKCSKDAIKMVREEKSAVVK